MCLESDEMGGEMLCEFQVGKNLWDGIGGFPLGNNPYLCSINLPDDG